MQRLKLATIVFVCVLAVLAQAYGQEQCGITESRLRARTHPTQPITDGTTNRIVGGKIAKRGSIPWQVSISCDINYHICGGTLISYQWVLTAAHCTTANRKFEEVCCESAKSYDDCYNNNSTTPENMAVTVGGDLRRSWRQLNLNYDVREQIVQWGYTEDSKDHDIALLRLKKSVLKGQATPICLPSSKNNRQRRPNLGPRGRFRPRVSRQRNYYISGWGKTDPNNDFTSDDLMTAVVTLYSKDTCERNYKGEIDIKITDNMICAGVITGGRDTCLGDSGGPLSYRTFQRGKGNVWYLLGLTSFGHTECGGFGNLGVYTKVRNYLPWIKNQMGYW